MRRAFAVAALILAPSAVGATQIGSVNQKDYNGAVGILTSGEQEELQYGTAVYTYETVVTEADSTTVLLFKDTSALQVGSNSRVVLDRFVYDPEPDSGEAVIKLGRGAFRLITGYSKHEDNLTLKTPTLSMVVRGTHLLIFVLGDGTTEVNVIDGEVAATPCRPPQGYSLLPSQALTVDPQCNAVRGTARDAGQRTDPPSMPGDLAARDTAPAAGPAPSTLPADGGSTGLRSRASDTEGGTKKSSSSFSSGGPAPGPSGPSGPQGSNRHHGYQ